MNAKLEFLKITSGFNIIAAHISFGEDYEDDYTYFKLYPLYSTLDYDNFLKFLDREYDSGYGGQKIFGTIFCEDNVWMTRGEYDGSEWWEINKYPDMVDFFGESSVLKYERNKKLKKINNERLSH